MATADVTVPFSVDDVVEQLFPTPPTSASEKTSGSASSLPSAHALLPLPSTIADAHRVQISIRGRRYETSLSVAVTYCLTFFAFFRCPFAGGKTVAEALTEATAAPNSDALLRHHVEVVEPLLLRFLRHQQQQQQEQEESAEVFVPPSLPRPVSITYDAAGKLWKFEYAARLSAEAEAAERQRQHRAGAAGSAGSTTAEAAAVPSTDDLNSSPFLLLQNDFMGVLLVYLRRSAKVRCDAAGSGAAPSYPALPIRWREMNYDDQVSFLQLLRAFGVVPLTAHFTRPTAALATSLFIGADAARLAAAAKAEGDACSLRAKANAFWQQQEQQQQQQQHQVESETHHMKRAARGGGDDDDDGVVLMPTGCARCGMAGHATTECPY